jgi:hypothetical protein
VAHNVGRTVKVTGVAYDNTSVKIAYEPVAGAADYRVYDVVSPTVVKYAGLYHNDSNDTNGVATSVDWTNLADGRSHGLVVQAVDHLGPVPGESLYTGNSTPLDPACAVGNGPLGLNNGKTSDGLTSANGQGPCTDVPRVIAQSPPFVVRDNPAHVPIPSTATSSQTYLDTFADSENDTIAPKSGAGLPDTATYLINAGTRLAASINYVASDTLHSYPFVSGHHFMDVLFDGGTRGSANPLHVRYGTMSFIPHRKIMLGNGILHLTMEVDGHLSDRRWVSFILAPASDTITNFNSSNAISSTNRALFLYFLPHTCTLNLYTGGGATPMGTAGGSYGSALWGALGQAPHWCRRNQNGLGIDNRSRFDLFVSRTRAALFENGALQMQTGIPRGSWSWSSQPLKALFSHYVYHTDNDVNELRRYACFPMSAYWFNDPARGVTACNTAYRAGYGFPHSDERHWSDIGFEVLPRGTAPGSDYSSLRKLIRMPSMAAPTFAPLR